MPMPAEDVTKMASKSDEQLYARLRDDADEAALQELRDRNWQRASRLARNVARDAGAAEYAAQQAFVRVLHAPRLKHDLDPFGAWLRGVVMRQALNGVRSWGRPKARERAASVSESTTRSRPMD